VEGDGQPVPSWRGRRAGDDVVLTTQRCYEIRSFARLTDQFRRSYLVATSATRSYTLVYRWLN